MSAIENVGDTEVREEELTKELGGDVELDTAEDKCRAKHKLPDDSVKCNVDNGDDEVPCAEMEITRDRGVDVLSDEGAEGATIEAIDKK